jgi:D-tyrosyl-tRNA(Tyr) deacylase
VETEGRTAGIKGPGLLILLGVTGSDTEKDCSWLAEKCACLRIFEDSAGKMNLSLSDVKGSALIISQFTLYASCERGRRPDFINAARSEKAEPLYELFTEKIRGLGIPVETGVFGAEMKVSLVNDGPVTIMLESPAPKNAGAAA